MRFCVDCEHYANPRGEQLCARHGYTKDLVTGQDKMLRPVRAEIERMDQGTGDNCGQEGRFWKARTFSIRK